LRWTVVVIFGVSLIGNTFLPNISYLSLKTPLFESQNRENNLGDLGGVVLAAASSFADFTNGELNSEEILSELNDNEFFSYNGFFWGEYDGVTIQPEDLTPVPKSNEKKTVRKEIITYIVQGGDTIWSISEKFDISVNTIKWANNLSNIDSIKPGQKLIILPVSGVLHNIKKGETLASIASFYKVDVAKIKEYNDVSGGLRVGQQLIIPGARMSETVIANRSSSKISSGSTKIYQSTKIGWMIRPTYGVRSRGVSSYHDGVDIANRIGTPVWAAAAGTVVYTGWYYGYGYTVIIQHPNGIQTLYGHLSAIYVGSGQSVSQGQQIGAMGNTGRSTGPHLHFEVRPNKYLNPF